MRILYVNKAYPPHRGGIEYHLSDLATRLASEHDITVLVVADKGEEPRTDIIDGVKVVRVSRSMNISKAPISIEFPSTLHRLSEEADIVHYHYPNPIGEISSLITRSVKPTVVTYHSDVVRQKLGLALYKPLITSFLTRADAIIATSPNYAKTSNILSMFENKTRIIPLGIDIHKFTNTLIGNTACDTTKNIICVGRLVYYKGIEYLIRAMVNIRAHLTIVGEGPLKSSLTSLATNLGVSDRIDFEGSVSLKKLVELYRKSSVFVMPSIERSEAFGLVQLEAMLCGLPAITTELGTGTSYPNLDGVTGFVVPPKDSNSLAHRINRLLGDDSLRRVMGEKARDRVISSFTLDLMVAKTVNLYDELLSKQ